MKTKERNTASSLGVPLLLLAIGLGAAPQVYPQVCEIEFSVLNKDRYVYGPVDNECSTSGGHSAPFGNWGVKTEISDKLDGHQFQGWCQFKFLCDNNDDCDWHCTDRWYEWNSCTYHEWSPPNSDFYNYNSNTQQRSTRGNNQHGGGRASLDAPSCPSDSDGDGVNDAGGCKEALSRGFSVDGHRMELYELDGKWIGRWFSSDTLVETLRFPGLEIAARDIDCDDADYCSESEVGRWRSPSNASSSGKTSAKAAIQIVRAVFSDPDSDCPCDPLLDPGCLATGGS